MSACPGQDGRYLSVSVHKCPECGSEIEMFSDETRARCHKCKSVVQKETTPSCVQWCTKARDCLGDERWKAIMGDEAEGADEAEEADDDGQSD